MKTERVTYTKVTFRSIAEALDWAKRVDEDEVAPHPEARFEVGGRMTLANFENYQRAASLAAEANARALERADEAALREFGDQP